MTLSGTHNLISEEDTQNLASALSQSLRAGDIVYLLGELGAGKSTFARALIRTQTAPNQDVPSPTFTLMQTYDGRDYAIAHLDLYRIEAPEEAYELGLDDLVADHVTLIEWPQKLEHLGFDDHLEIVLNINSDATRTATLTPKGRFLFKG